MIPQIKGLSADQIAGGEYVFDSAWHVHMCLSWLDYAKRSGRPQCLRYAAIELRTSVEMLWFEIFVVTMGGTIPAAEYARCSKEATKMYKLIDRVAPDYRKLMQFMDILLNLEHAGPQIVVWDIDRLKRIHGQASEFLHFQGAPFDTHESPLWLGNGISKLESMANYIWGEITSGKQTGNMPLDKMEPETKAVWEQFRDDKLDKVGVRTQLLIAKPVLTARRRIGRK